jgi:hypothetical protein
MTRDRHQCGYAHEDKHREPERYTISTHRAHRQPESNLREPVQWRRSVSDWENLPGCDAEEARTLAQDHLERSDGEAMVPA